MSEDNGEDSGLNWVGLAGMIVFYFLIFFAGLFSEKLLKRGKKEDEDAKPTISNTDDMMLAGRDINYFVGIFTMTATWVGGGYINGAAEATIKSGILWCQAPFCYAISLVCGGLFFAKKMRDSEFVTMLDPFQNKYGRTLGAIFYIPAFSGEILWSASILAALGTSLRVICGLNDETSIIISACIAMTYTLFGGLYSVAFTDVFQLICIFVGLILAIPFMASHDAVTIPLQNANLTMFSNPNFTKIYDVNHTVLGSISKADAGVWADYLIMMMCGGIPWQAYFQRVLSSRDASVARVLSMAAGFGCFCAAIPAVIIGVITVNTDWTQFGLTMSQGKDEFKLAVPRTLMHLCPPVISFIGLGAVSAAVMSSTDSSILGISSMFTRNVFKKVLYPGASDCVTLWFLRGTVVVNTAIAMTIAICVKSVYGLYLICSDLVFILLFPHLLLIVHFPKRTNKYGLIVGFSIAFILRVLAGEPVLGYEAVMKWPGYNDVEDGVGNQRFPFRVVCMLLHLGLTILFSWLFEMAFRREWIPSKFDFMHVLKESTKINPGERPDETKC